MFLCSAFSAAVHYAVHLRGNEGDEQVDCQGIEMAEMKTTKTQGVRKTIKQMPRIEEVACIVLMMS